MFAVAAFYQSGTFRGLYHVWYFNTIEQAIAFKEKKMVDSKNLQFMPILEEVE